jgi:hypothetical protein
MRATVARMNKSSTRSQKARSEYKFEEGDSIDSEHLFKIDKELIRQNATANFSMHQTNNSSRRGSRIRGQQIITKRDPSRNSSKSSKKEEPPPSSFITVVGGSMTLNSSKYIFDLPYLQQLNSTKGNRLLSQIC